MFLTLHHPVLLAKFKDGRPHWIQFYYFTWNHEFSKSFLLLALFFSLWDKPSVHQKHQTSYSRYIGRKLMGNARKSENRIQILISTLHDKVVKGLQF